MSDLGLVPVSYAIVSGVNGQERAAVYYVDFCLPSGVQILGVQAIEGNPSGCDMLIGMDVIGHGDFFTSCCEGTTHFVLKSRAL